MFMTGCVVLVMSSCHDKDMFRHLLRNTQESEFNKRSLIRVHVLVQGHTCAYVMAD